MQSFTAFKLSRGLFVLFTFGFFVLGAPGTRVCNALQQFARARFGFLGPGAHICELLMHVGPRGPYFSLVLTSSKLMSTFTLFKPSRNPLGRQGPFFDLI